MVACILLALSSSDVHSIAVTKNNQQKFDDMVAFCQSSKNITFYEYLARLHDWDEI